MVSHRRYFGCLSVCIGGTYARCVGRGGEVNGETLLRSGVVT